MVTIKFKHGLLLSVLCIYSAAASAQGIFQAGFDIKTASIISMVTSSEAANAAYHNNILDEIKKAQQNIMGHTTVLDALTQAYHGSMRSIAGFDENSAMYKQLLGDAKKIGVVTPEIIKILRNNTGENTLKLCLSMGDMTTEAASLMSAYISICSNGSINNPLSDAGGVTRNDSYNLMTRQDRVEAANQICGRMSDLRKNLEKIYDLLYTNVHLSTFHVFDRANGDFIRDGKANADRLITNFRNLKY